MGAILRHRGPDGDGCWTGAGIVLAHTRLAIVDPTSASDQPMHDQSNTIHVVFNGEIYNFRELRSELCSAGYTFRSAGDTEVIVNGYRAWGTGLFSKLVGMFAVAIWDSREERLVLARDRLGEKPLYYSLQSNVLLAGSEIKAILTWPGLERRPNYAVLHDFLSFSYISGTETAFCGIHRLPPAHFMICDRGKAPVLQRYWHLPPAGHNAVRLSLADLQHELIERVQAAVSRCLVADVPLGAFLSGGVDSSAVVAMMAKCGVGQIETFSSGFGLQDYDETQFAAAVASRYQTNHQAFTFGNTVVAGASALAWHYDEPFADSSALVTYALARETRKSVTVALTGDGADETLLGYSRYFRFGDMMRAVPPGGGRRFPQLYAGRVLATDAARTAADAYGYLVETFRERHKLIGYDLALLAELDRCTYDNLAAHVSQGLTPEEQAGRIDIETYLPGDLLVKVDVASMAHGLETRAPFLNHELVEWISRIPADQKVWQNEGKALLKSALEPYLPYEVMYRPKMGFRVPVAHLMRHELHDLVRSILLGNRFLDRRLIRRSFLQEMLAEHHAGSQNHGTRLWALLSLELWFRTWIDSCSNLPLAGPDDPFAEFSGQLALTSTAASLERNAHQEVDEVHAS
jgi:asparagine synthase (glutamine-hydrolysing)